MRVLTFILAITLTICGWTSAQEASTKEAARHDALSKQVTNADANAAKRLQNIERQLKQEESRMNARIAQLGKMRDSALQKGDSKQLKRIEQMELQAVSQYDKRVTKILGGAGSNEDSTAVAPQPTRANHSLTNPRQRTMSRQQGVSTSGLRQPGRYQRQLPGRQRVQHAGPSPTTARPSTSGQRRAAPPVMQAPGAAATRAKARTQDAVTQPQRGPKRSRRFRLWPFN